MSSADRSATRALLADRHTDSDRFVDDAWLEWLYDENPVGVAIEAGRDLDGRCMGHVGLVPQRWRSGDEIIGTVLALNVVTSEASDQPLFMELLGEGLTTSFQRGDSSLAWGITNDQSSVAAERDIPHRQFGPLPVVLARSSRPRGVRSETVDPLGLDSNRVRAVVGDLDLPPPQDWRHEWTHELLAWRLSAPGRSYALHVSDAAIAVSTTTRWGLRVGVLTKLLPLRDPVPAGDVRRLVGAIRRHHRVGPVVYAGFNRQAPVSGVAVPGRLRPAALNLSIVGGDDAVSLGVPVEHVDPMIAASEFVFEACELLDFDAL